MWNSIESQITDKTMALFETIVFILFKFFVICVKIGLIYAILVTCVNGLEDDRQGSVNQRSPSVQFIISVLFLILTATGIYGVFTNHLGLFLTWFLLRPIVYILDLEDTVWSAVAMALIGFGGTLSYVTYESSSALSSALVWLIWPQLHW